MRGDWFTELQLLRNSLVGGLDRSERIFNWSSNSRQVYDTRGVMRLFTSIVDNFRAARTPDCHAARYTLFRIELLQRSTSEAEIPSQEHCLGRALIIDQNKGSPSLISIQQSWRQKSRAWYRSLTVLEI